MSPSTTKHAYSIATIGADGIGPEVVNAGVQVLKKLAQLDGTFQLHFTEYDWSSETYKKTGRYIPPGGLEDLKKHDAILFGAVGAPGTLGFQILSNQLADRRYRCPRSHLFMGPAARNLSDFPAICKCQAYEDLSWNIVSVAKRGAWRS
jgi:hypothetical protein